MMASILSIVLTASTATSLFSFASAQLVTRNQGPSAPPCGVPFTPYLYAGCYSDPGSPRALPFVPGLRDDPSLTVDECVAECKGNSYTTFCLIPRRLV